MNRRETVLLLLALGTAPLLKAQQATRAYRVGFLSAATASAIAFRTEAFRQGLRQLGYDEQNMTIEFRFSDGDVDQLRDSAMELVRQKVDVIVTAGPIVTRIARDATSIVPIVMIADTDPVGMRFVKTLARPGGNITGMSSLGSDLVGKQLEFLKAVTPRLARLAILWNPDEPGIKKSLRDTQTAAKKMGMQVQLLEQWGPDDMGPALDAAKRGRADALIVLRDSASNAHRSLLVKLANESRIPAIYWGAQFVDVGGLLSYAAAYDDLARRAAGYVDKILKGARPADLPVQQPTKFELTINKRTAGALGITIPQTLLLRADRVVE